jgi:peroxiredoxin
MKTTAFLAAILLLACGRPATPPSADQTPAEPSVVVTNEMGSPHVGDVAPDFDLVDQAGAHVKLADMRGSVVVLAFVTSYCPFSKAAQPSLAELARTYAPRGVKVVAVNVKEGDAEYREYVSRMSGQSFSVLRDPDGAVSLAFTPAKAQPEVLDRTKVVVTSNLVIDKKGKIRFFTLLDTQHFDAKLVHLRRSLDRVMEEG